MREHTVTKNGVLAHTPSRRLISKKASAPINAQSFKVSHKLGLRTMMGQQMEIIVLISGFGFNFLTSFSNFLNEDNDKKHKLTSYGLMLW